MRFLVASFFAAYLVGGLCVFGDYGIGWDEPMHRQQGRRMYEYLTTGNPRGVRHHMRYHGPALDTALYAIEKHLDIEDVRDAYRARHLVYFLVFFTGVFFFYLLVTRHLRSPSLGLLGAVFLVLSPRLFADAFYNPKDVPCLALFIVSMHTLACYAERKTNARALLHALSTSILLTIRLVGVLVPLFTTITVLRDRRAVRSYALYTLVTVGLVILFWPTLWRNPPYHLLQALRSYGQYEGWPGTMLYMGNEVRSIEIPWHYVPVWIVITTPLTFVLCFIVGCVRLAKSEPFPWLVIAAWFFLPLISIVVLDSVVYDTWRHVYFVYPAFLLIALLGLKWIGGLKRRAVTAIVAIVIVFDLALTLRFMIRNHPHQHLYFNALVGGVAGAKDRFELDYWGVTYYAALKHLLEAYPGQTLKLYAAHSPGKYNTALLPSESRSRIVLLDEPGEAEYYVTNFRFGDRVPPSFTREVYTERVDGATVITIYGR